MADTPLMKQYRDIKIQYPESVLFFRLGDFYEMFYDDAVEVSALLNLTLTHRVDAPMCGIPYHAAQNYIKRLLELGKKIAICEQLEIPKDGKTLARREVVRVITPATVLDEDLLGAADSNFIFCIFRTECAWCDISTGEFVLKTIDKSTRIQSLRMLIEQLCPKEILVCDDEYYIDKDFKSCIDFSGALLTKLPPWYFNQKNAFKLLCSTADVSSLKAFGIEENDKIVTSAGALLKYALENSKTALKQIKNYVVEKDSEFVEIDEFSRRNLELFNNNSNDGVSLFSVINRCKTYGGTRLLKSWLAFPLKSLQKIKLRQQNVNFFYSNAEELNRVRKKIGLATDLSRISTRILLKRAVPHDLTSLKQAVYTFIQIVSEKYDYYSSLFNPVLLNSQLVQKALDFAEEIERAVNPEFLGQFNAGSVILSGYDKDLDEKRNLQQKGNEVIKDYLEELTAETSMTILKTGYNKIFGYYIEVPKGQVSKVPSYFVRKQTLVNGERFTTQKLDELEKKILISQSEAVQKETEIFLKLVDKAAELTDIFQAMGAFMNEIDVYQALAVLAIDSAYVCPQITEDDVLQIEGGRHATVEHVLGAGKFVPNDYSSDTRFALITGPNMAGKSTYLRQNALIILLAHIGSFVPAKKATVGLVDHIFCRVGASDNLARGESTFLVEMQETAFILRTCTKRSFVIVDEIGRGTSTQDGMSIAWAVMNELLNKGCKTLFATHYHELTMIDTSNIKLLTLQVEETNKNVVFLRKVVEGVANSSYGLHVARMAGIPYPVVKNAESFQKRHFADYGSSFFDQDNLFLSAADDSSSVSETDLSSDLIIQQLKECDPDSLTPLQAMIFLSKLKEQL